MTVNAKTNYLEDAIINYVLRNDPDVWASPGTIYLGMFTAAPGETGGGTEVSAGNYARQTIAFDDPAGGGLTQNSSEISFPIATVAWGTVTHFALFDALTSGNMLYYGALDTPRTIGVDDVLVIGAGELSVEEL